MQRVCFEITSNVAGRRGCGEEAETARGLGARVPNWVNSDEGFSGRYICRSHQLAASFLSFLPPPFLSSSSPSSPPPMAQDSPQASSSHMMKTTKRGRPFLKVTRIIIPVIRILRLTVYALQDTLDLFATLIVSLQLTTHKQFFRTFPNSFTTCVPPLPVSARSSSHVRTATRRR